MPYSTHIRSVQRVEPILKQLVESTSTLEFPSNQPDRDIYHIRDGIKSSKHRAFKTDDIYTNLPNEPYHSYAQLDTKYIFKSAPGRVIAQLRSFVQLVPIAASAAIPTMVIRDASNEMEVVGAIITHKAQRMNFPNVDDLDLVAVYEWCKANNYWMIVDGKNGLTVTTEDIGDVAWKP